MALSVSELISVSINVSPTAAASRGFGVLLVVGDSNVISTTERLRGYASLTGVLADFANTTPEYLAAQIYFAQQPTPKKIMIGRQGTTESPLDAIQACAIKSSEWYACMFASTTMPTEEQTQAVASFIEATTPARVFGFVTNDTDALNIADTTSLVYTLKQLNLSRTVAQYSTSPAYAIAAFFGRALSVDFTANKTTITMMYKQEVLITAETLTSSQAASLKAHNCNVFVNYDNATAIIQHGVVVGGRFFDEVHGLDWLQNALQTAVYNLFYQSTTKIPQTDSGVGQVKATCTSVLNQAVSNGLVAAGKWGADGFGALKKDDILDAGYYIYTAPIATQSAADREARICPAIQIAVKLAGAIHSVAITVNVNR